MDHMPETVLWRAWPRAGSVTVGRYPRREDTFTERNIEETAGHLREPLKKTVSFAVRGREAGFVTVLETGERTGKVASVNCTGYDSVIVTEDTGRAWVVTAAGMEEKEAEVLISIVEMRR